MSLTGLEDYEKAMRDLFPADRIGDLAKGNPLRPPPSERPPPTLRQRIRRRVRSAWYGCWQWVHEKLPGSCSHGDCY